MNDLKTSIVRKEEVNVVKKGFMFLFILLLFVGCQVTDSDSDMPSIAKQHLQQQGYTIISHEWSSEPYTLERDRLDEEYLVQVWQVQAANKEDYIGKEIYEERFIVKNHPLDDWDGKGLGKTNVYVMLVDGQVIGGTSFPITEESLVGAPFSLDGKTAEEVSFNKD